MLLMDGVRITAVRCCEKHAFLYYMLSLPPAMRCAHLIMGEGEARTAMLARVVGVRVRAADDADADLHALGSPPSHYSQSVYEL